MSHNIVVVDGVSQNAKDRRSRLELFGRAPGVEVMQASAIAYTQCPEYRRTCALVRLPGGGNYVVDFFRVTGGKLHQYCLNCNGKFLGLGQTQVAPIADKISEWLANLRATEPPEAWDATWEFGGVKMRLIMAGPLQRLVVADAPGWRSYKGDQLHAPPITQILAERKGERNLRSVYSSVMCPYRGEESPVKAIRRLVPEPASDTAAALAVELDDHTDIVISSLDDEPRSYGPVRMSGRFGMVSLDKAGKLLRAYLLDGTELSCGGRDLKLKTARIVRRVLKVEGRKLELDEPLPGDSAVAGSYLLTGETGFEIESVEGKVLTVRDYPFEGGKEIVMPNQAWISANK
jgi:hypothetical protein